MKGYYILNDYSRIIVVPWILFAFYQDGKFFYKYEENFLENQIIQIKRSGRIDDKFNEIDIPDRYIKKFVDICHSSCDKEEIDKEAENLIGYVLRKAKI